MSDMVIKPFKFPILLFYYLPKETVECAIALIIEITSFILSDIYNYLT
jgi:hypothetical protein